MVAQVVYIVGHAAVSQVQVVGLCRIFGCQRVNLFYYRHDAYAFTVVTNFQDTVFHIAFVADGTCHLEVRESLTFCLVEQLVWKL